MNENMTPLPCPACDGADLTEPFDANFEYVVCQHCGLRAERDSWNRMPRLAARVKELEEALVDALKLLGMDRPIDPSEILEAALNKEPT